MVKDTSSQGKEPWLGKVLHDDLRRGDFRRTLRRDINELKEYFLDDDRKARLGEMRRVKRWLFTAGWLLKSLFLKLTPTRRILFIVSLVLLMTSHSFDIEGKNTRVVINTNITAGFILVFILMLELKDKLLAQDELEEGRAVQLTLTPQRSPSIPGWSCWLFTRTANEVGGDLVDVQKIDESQFLFSLADVAGKGLKAALVTAKLQATIRALATESRSLGELGAKINKIFHRDTPRNMFASLVSFQLAPDSNVIRLINAGHLPPITVRESKFEEMKKGDPAIGIFPDAKYAEEQFEIRKGELLFIYSDGLSEAKNERGEFFGTSRLFRLVQDLHHLSPTEMGERVVQAVDMFIGDARIFDDLSVVIVKREE